VPTPDLGKVLGRVETVDKNLASVLRYIQERGLAADHTRVDPGWAVPRGRTVNVFVIIEAQSELLVRHEGGEDVSTEEVEGVEVPVILHEKLASAWRRHMLEVLRSHYDRGGRAAIAKALGKGGDWAYTCGLRPAVVEVGAKKETRIELIGGLCGECPNCMVFGFAVREGGLFNVKSRVEGDAYFAVEPATSSVVQRTFNAVDEALKTTAFTVQREEAEGEEGEARRTGALFRLSLVRAGTLFVGKVAMKDLSVPELLLALYTLATVPRVGGYKSDFGRIKVYIPAIVPGRFEVGSGYELAARILAQTTGRRPGLEEVWQQATAYAEELAAEAGYTAFKSQRPGFGAALVRALADESVFDAVVMGAWEAAANARRSYEEYIKAK